MSAQKLVGEQALSALASDIKSAVALKANSADVYPKTDTYTKQETDDEINEALTNVLPKATVSGSIATFTTSLELPLVAMSAEINSQTGLKGLNYWYGRESSWSDVVQIVRSGNAPTLLPIGSQITDKWTNGANGTTYDFVWDVVNYGNYEKADGTTAFGMVLQAHYCDPIGMPFSGYPALLACPNGLNAGTYHFKISANWGSISGNTDYQFTLTQDVPNNGLVCAPNNWPDVAVANWKITTYASNTSATALEQVALTAGNGGTDLGTFTPGYSSATMNGYQAAAYGYNRWSKSAIRQWLNSDAAAGAWWHPQTVWDMAPSKAATERGFLAGFTDDFKHVLHETKIKTALNTSDKTKEGVGFEYTYDKLFLPALEQMYINPQATGDDAEGAYWEYYKELNGTDTKYATGGTYPELIKYDLTNHSTARYQRLRSAVRGYSYYVWRMYTSGAVGYGGHAIGALQCAPACIII